MKFDKIFITLVLLLSSASAFAFESNLDCSSKEKWNWSKNAPLSEDDFEEFIDSITGDSTFADSSKNAQKFLEKKPGDEFTQKLYLYWNARALMNAGMPHIALDLFSNVFDRSSNHLTAPIYGAALSCINSLKLKYPSILTAIQFKNASKSLPLKFHPLLAEYAVSALQSDIANGKKLNLRSEEYSFVKKSKLFSSYILGLLAAQKSGNSKKVIVLLEGFLGELKAMKKKEDLLVYQDVDSIRLILARAYYEQKDYSNAQRVYSDISSSSNFLPEKLTELGWTYLVTGNYSKAIGIASQLQSSHLKVAFAPDSWSIISMSLNELCQFPLAKNMIRQFYGEYSDVSKWLKSYPRNTKNLSLYEAVTGYLTNSNTGKAQIPAQLLVDWSRSKVFVNSQSEIHLLFSEKKNFDTVISQVVNKNLKNKILNSSRKFTSRQLELSQSIEKYIQSRVHAMKNELDSVSESLQLVQIEVNTGASHDMIFQNAHEEYSKDVKQGEYKGNLRAQQKSPVWNWGNAKRDSKNTELWEDEIGTLQSRVGNLCKAKKEFINSNVSKN